MKERQVETYILAKDGNRPHLLRRVFAEDAQLEMILNTSAISFPPAAQSREEIADILVRQFGATYENVHTFCLRRPGPAESADSFSCGWAVGMTEKASGQLRIGCGRYDWRFSTTSPHRVRSLRITIYAMETLPVAAADPVLDWLAGLPYPWCSAEIFVGKAPDIAALRSLLGLVCAVAS